MTLTAVKEGVFRAHAPSDSRGRRKRRGEFVPLGSAYAVFAHSQGTLAPAQASVPSLPKDACAELEALPELRVHQDTDGSGRVTLQVSGILDISTVLPFRDTVFTAIGNKPLHLTVDATRLRDMDVAGVSALVTARRVAQLMKVPFTVMPSPSLEALLEDTGILLTAPSNEPLI
ncbi:MAG: STAS domain-containing protein [Armatimonadota bacterium]